MLNDASGFEKVYIVTENISWFTAYDKYFKGAAFTQLLKYNKVLFLLGK